MPETIEDFWKRRNSERERERSDYLKSLPGEDSTDWSRRVIKAQDAQWVDRQLDVRRLYREWKKTVPWKRRSTVWMGDFQQHFDLSPGDLGAFGSWKLRKLERRRARQGAH